MGKLSVFIFLVMGFSFGSSFAQESLELFPPVNNSARIGVQFSYKYGMYYSQIDLSGHNAELGVGYSISNFAIANLLIGYGNISGTDNNYGRSTNIKMTDIQIEGKFSPLSLMVKRIKTPVLPVINVVASYNIAHVTPTVKASAKDEPYADLPSSLDLRYPGLAAGLEIRVHLISSIDFFVAGYGGQFYTQNMAGHSFDKEGMPFDHISVTNVVASGFAKFGITLWISGDGSGFFRKYNNYVW